MCVHVTFEDLVNLYETDADVKNMVIVKRDLLIACADSGMFELSAVTLDNRRAVALLM